MAQEAVSIDEQKLIQIAALAAQNKATGYDTELFEDQESIKKNSLECAICTGVIKQATSILACGHVFCSFCITDALKRRKACPVCAAVIDDADKAVAPALFVDRLVQQLRLKCPHSAKGCSWQGLLSDLAAHVDNACDHNLFLCEYSRAGCDAILTRASLTTHNAERTSYHLDLVFGALLATQALNEQLQDRVTALEQRATRWEAHYAEFVSSPLLQRLLHKAAEEEKLAKRSGGSLSSARRDEAKQGRLTPSVTDGAVTNRSVSEHSNPPSSRQAPASPAANPQPQPVEAAADEDVNSTLVMDMEKLDRMMQIPELMGNPEVNKFLTSVKAAPDLMQTPEVERFLVSVWEQVSAQLQ